MPISSYPRITLNNTQKNNNAQNGTGIVIYDLDNSVYKVLDSNTIPVNAGGLPSENTAIGILDSLNATDYAGETIGNTNYEIKRNTEKQIGASILSISDLLVSVTNDATAGDMLYDINQSLLTIVSLLQNGTGAIQILGGTGNIANVNGDKQLLVKT